MKKRAPRRKNDAYERDEFQAYGEYTYDYLHQSAPKDEEARQAQDDFAPAA